MEIAYITTRELENSAGKINGKIRIIVLKGESIANIELTCPECKTKEKKNEEWKTPFNTKCDKCGFQVKIQSLRKEIKKNVYKEIN